jgi:predicted methyltransferase
MLIQLDERLVQQLEVIAQKEGRDVDTFVQRVLGEIAQRYTEEKEFDTLVDQLMTEHAWLLDELSRR